MLECFRDQNYTFLLVEYDAATEGIKSGKENELWAPLKDVMHTHPHKFLLLKDFKQANQILENIEGKIIFMSKAYFDLLAKPDLLFIPGMWTIFTSNRT